ncbi:TVP38/TMEM64 family protein [uncultured Meiothermus sp.]|jgi:uncharacterized membrane protein YdjX (TVP38/TMEM64 family)|uniref:TVP38/TMEM64 family protein n=1 Tax=uncultured Meiothermus sp. TaxID=157471 RepID=UPI002622FB58|nr:TVP38/TMEM64 family protein [uncultured Meiothermus sp.]
MKLPAPTLPLIPIFLVLLFLVSLLIGSYFAFPGFKERLDWVYGLLSSGNQQAIQAWVAGLGWFGPLSIIGLMIAQTLVSVVPMTLVMLISVLAFGPVYGGILGWIGAIIAALVGYSIARVLGPVVVDRFVSEKIRLKVEEPVQRYGPWAVIALRLSFLVPTDSVNFVAGLVRMHPLKFLLATSVGAAPVAVVVAWLGADFSRLGPFLLVATLVGLTALGGWILYDQTRLRRKASPSESEST